MSCPANLLQGPAWLGEQSARGVQGDHSAKGVQGGGQEPLVVVVVLVDRFYGKWITLRLSKLDVGPHFC